MAAPNVRSTSAPLDSSGGSPSTQVQPAPSRHRRHRQRNWETPEIMALIKAKSDEHQALLDVVDARSRMESSTVRWQRIAQKVQEAGVSPQTRDDVACLTKWNALIGDYKKITDYVSGTGVNETYWSMSIETREELGLPRNFNMSHYMQMDEFLHDRPGVTPSNLRDSSRPPAEGDATQGINNSDGEDMPMGEEDLFSQDPVTNYSPDMLHPGSSWATEFDGRGQRRPRSVAGGIGTINLSDTDDSHRAPPQPRSVPASSESVPHGAARAPIEISSSAGTTACSTGKKRKSSTSQKLVEAQSDGNKAMVESIDKIHLTNLQIEEKRSKDLSTICDKQLEYFRVRDRQINKVQRGLVNAIAGLSQVMGRALSLNNPHGVAHSIPVVEKDSAIHVHADGGGPSQGIPGPVNLDNNIEVERTGEKASSDGYLSSSSSASSDN